MRRSLIASAIVVSCCCLATESTDYRAGSLAKQEVQPVYSADLHDPWNRIFYLLFTRKVEARLTRDFSVEGPFVPTHVMGDSALPVTERTYERIESGDRAIDPLYPNFFSAKGSEPILTDPGFTDLKQALEEACAEKVARPALDRALMQPDVWAAYEIVSWSRTREGTMGDHARALAPLLRQFIAKLALTDEEISALPHNYVAAQSALPLPRVFDERSGWIEIEWFPVRSHDEMAEDRHAARVFLKPVAKPQQFLDEVNRRIRERKDPLPGGMHDLEAAALLTQVLLIDQNGHVVPSPLISDVQMRTSTRYAQGNFKSSTVDEFELSRRAMVHNPASGGFIHRRASEPAYLAASGNDFTFASPMIAEREPTPPVLATLRHRCESCHGDEARVFTFGMIQIPERQSPILRHLHPSEDQRALFVAAKKMEQKDFKSLHLGK